MSASNVLYSEDLHFFVTNYFLDELNMIRRIELGNYYFKFLLKKV